MSSLEETNQLTLQELLYNRGLPQTSRTKIVRHRDTSGNIDLLQLYQDEPQKFLDYQRQQGNPVFDRCEYLVSLLGEEGSSARFVGVYRVEGIDYKTEEHIYYRLTPMSGFEDLEERVIIDWGKAAISWHQWFERKAPKYVLEIQRQRFQKPFRDYLDFTLTFGALRQLVATQGAADEWRRMLSAVKGVYLIRDLSTGHQYIGSAYREGGIWGRWVEYVNTNGHGGNVELRKLLAADNAHARHFQFTILMTLSRTTTDQEVIKWEQRFKEKIGAKLCLN